MIAEYNSLEEEATDGWLHWMDDSTDWMTPLMTSWLLPFVFFSAIIFWPHRTLWQGSVKGSFTIRLIMNSNHGVLYNITKDIFLQKLCIRMIRKQNPLLLFSYLILFTVQYKFGYDTFHYKSVLSLNYKNLNQTWMWVHRIIWDCIPFFFGSFFAFFLLNFFSSSVMSSWYPPQAARNSAIY